MDERDLDLGNDQLEEDDDTATGFLRDREERRLRIRPPPPASASCLDTGSDGALAPLVGMAANKLRF